MIMPPTSSPMPILVPSTNTFQTHHRLQLFPPTPPADDKPKKRPIREDKKPQKRLKLDVEKAQSESEDSDSDYNEDVDTEKMNVVLAQPRRNPLHIYTRSFGNAGNNLRRQTPSTLPVLQSFVSSHKSDMFKLESCSTEGFLTPPYACSFSHSAKGGGTPLLAVATEQGTVHILNTSKRKDWDVEPQRTTIQAHTNGIFDVKWSLDDRNLATSSGDQSTRISCATTGTMTHVLRGHSGTVKCAAWDPTHSSLLATGGRDGAICLWDLRVGEQQQAGEVVGISPVMTIYGAHEDTLAKGKPRARRGKQVASTRAVTNVLYPDSQPYGLVSSGSFDGILQYWDLRVPATPRRSRTVKPKTPPSVYSSAIDPTTLHGSRRPRGIIRLTSGTGPSAGLIFGLAADSRIHTYGLPYLNPQSSVYAHDDMQSSFYVGLSISPCGRWLACGGSGTKGSSFLFDVENAGRHVSMPQRGVKLTGQTGEVGAVDWTRDSLATCTDDGTVRVWRPDLDIYRQCVDDPEKGKWDWAWSM